MNIQHQLILSIGSNIEPKETFINDAICHINNEIGTIIKTSSLYETEAWGFESDAFYNAVLWVHTFKNPHQILKKIIKIEKLLGRNRAEKSTTYQARTIDIDIVAFNDEIILDNDLQIPHKQIHKRNFVLQPLLEILPTWEHPTLQKSIAELVKESTDTTVCKQLKPLEYPLQKFTFKNLNLMVIEGNIGAGKTTLSQKISEDFNAKLVLERFADNPFLPKFYEDQNRYAFPLEMSFLADRYRQIMDDLAQFDLFKEFVVADYHIFKSLIFAKVTLQEDEFKLYKTMFDIMYKEIPKPNLYIYLYQNTPKLLQNIKKRGRGYEQKIAPEYLNKINDGYLEFIKTHSELNVKIIDSTDKDFVKNPADYQWILEQISSFN